MASGVHGGEQISSFVETVFLESIRNADYCRLLRLDRTHLLQDLQPYLCTYSECDKGDQLFRSRREWTEHEASHRKAWRCPEHSAAVYKSPSGLEQHLREEHGHNISQGQLDSVVKVGETSMVDTREACPICFARTDMEGLESLQNRKRIHILGVPSRI
jgi:hypothetical protein